MKRASVKRKTKETNISIEIAIDGKGSFSGTVPNGFFQHMLESLAKHSGISMDVNIKGDVHVDLHHSVEDTGIVLGMALKEALGDKMGINRFGSAVVPMDEALVLCALDISGRGAFFMEGKIPSETVGTFPTELVEEFFIAFAREAGITLHVRVLSGKNAHHTVEAIFKAVARALKEAIAVSGEGIPSTKGVL